MTMLNRRRATARMGRWPTRPVAVTPGVGPVRPDRGVARSDPSSDGATLLTRAAPPPGQVRDFTLIWHVAPIGGRDALGLRSGRAIARAARDFTATVGVTGLRPGHDYRYWFETADGVRWGEGRFRTLPPVTG